MSTTAKPAKLGARGFVFEVSNSQWDSLEISEARNLRLFPAHARLVLHEMSCLLQDPGASTSAVHKGLEQGLGCRAGFGVPDLKFSWLSLGKPSTQARRRPSRSVGRF